MSETLISRVMRIVSGNINDGIDELESNGAETVMREALREIEKTVSDVRSEARTANGNRLLASKRLTMTDAKMAELMEKAQFAIAQNRDDLAEAALSRQLDLEAQIPVLKKAEENSEKSCEELTGFMEALMGRKSEMEAELEAFIEMNRQPDLDKISAQAANENKLEKRADDAIEAFERAMSSSNATGGVTKSDTKTIVQMGELNSFIRKSRISDRLKELKASIKKDQSAEA